MRFRDIANPKLVERVDPDNLARSFGAGTNLRRITVERTEDAVTTGIERRFAWWSAYKNRHFDGGRRFTERQLGRVLVLGIVQHGVQTMNANVPSQLLPTTIQNHGAPVTFALPQLIVVQPCSRR